MLLNKLGYLVRNNVLYDEVIWIPRYLNVSEHH